MELEESNVKNDQNTEELIEIDSNILELLEQDRIIGGMPLENEESLPYLVSQLFVIKPNILLSAKDILIGLVFGNTMGLLGSYEFKKQNPHRTIGAIIEKLKNLGFNIQKHEGKYIFETKASKRRGFVKFVSSQKIDEQGKPYIEEHETEAELREKIQYAIDHKKLIIFDYLFDDTMGEDEIKELNARFPKLKKLTKTKKKRIYLSPYDMRDNCVIGGRLEKGEQAFPIHCYNLQRMSNLDTFFYGKQGDYPKIKYLQIDNILNEFNSSMGLVNIQEQNFYHLYNTKPWEYIRYEVTYSDALIDDLFDHVFFDVAVEDCERLSEDEGGNEERKIVKFVSKDELHVFSFIKHLKEDEGASNIRFKPKQQQKRYEEWLEKQKKD